MPDPGLKAHREWLGLIQPTGLVVAPSALLEAQVLLDQSFKDKWLAYDALLTAVDGERKLTDWVAFAREFLEWQPPQLAGAPGGPVLPDTLIVSLPEFEDRLQPTYAVPDPKNDEGWALLIQVEPVGSRLDRLNQDDHHGWRATPHERFERLLRETAVGTGLLVSEDIVRLVHAPRGESSGYLSFPVATMATPHGRPMLQALYELLKGWRLSKAAPSSAQLSEILKASRRYQNVVSTRLAEQVLGALYELVRGTQAADDAAAGTILQVALREARGEVYGALLTTIMRLVFVLYAEERDMLPREATWSENYGVGALFERLRNDKARYPDTMDQRYGAWARLLTLFRILHDGASHDGIRIPAREGDLFDPDRYPFLEGRPWGTRRVLGDRLALVPRVSDGTILRVLELLLMLEGERLSYRSLDVEQIGSVYEAMMGFEIQAATGRSISVKPKTKKQGSPSHTVVDLDALLGKSGADRLNWLKEEADCELPASDAASLKEASNLDGLLEALGRRISPFTPQPANRGAMVLVPTEERRRSGSHYTPRELTEPIVATTLRPILEALGPTPTPEQLLELRICDPAMGSGAFLVGACRFLGERVVDAWQRAGTTPAIPPDEDVHLYARRLVAQRCLFGVDRNPYAVQLAKLSLWLVTLAREHPFTFVDHALRAGDSLVGLTLEQITAFHWDAAKASDPRRGRSIWAPQIEDWIKVAEGQRQGIEALAATDDTKEKVRLLREADDDLRVVRRIGDTVIAAFFGAEKDKARENLRRDYEQLAAGAIGDSDATGRLSELADHLRDSEPPISPFHWEVEFPEVFRRTNPGFDAIVGNPPFLGGRRVRSSLGDRYFDWLPTLHSGANSNSDLSAHFFRRAYHLLRDGGAFGLLATNTIAQGDTRATGLQAIRRAGGWIFAAIRRLVWPGTASVVVSVIHVQKGRPVSTALLDGRNVKLITAFLFHEGSDDDPAVLPENDSIAYSGTVIAGKGFVFDDDDPQCESTATARLLMQENPRNSERIRPFIGGEEVNSDPSQAPTRFVIDFDDLSESEARTWPELFRIVQERVLPNRSGARRAAHSTRWWQFGDRRPELYGKILRLSRVLVNAQTSPQLAFAFLPTGMIYSHALNVYTIDCHRGFAVLQSRVHEVWARFFGSTMKDDLRYSTSDCFDSFPFPVGWRESDRLERLGQAYSGHRAQVMVANEEGLTTTYNRFHDPNEKEPGVLRLRHLHATMDGEVLEAYGWADLQPSYDFFLDYVDEEEGDDTRRRKPWRYRWSDSFRDEVLARLLELNRERANGGLSL